MAFEAQIMTPSILITISAGIALALGVIHLYLTFFTRSFAPRDVALETALKTVSPRISGQTTMWKAQTGFNASHSMGVILFGLVYAYLALEQTAALFHSRFLLGLGVVTLVAYMLLARRYWFAVPLLGISLSLGFFLAGISAAYNGG